MKKQWIVVWLCVVGLSWPGLGLCAQQTATGGATGATEVKMEEGGAYTFNDTDIGLALSTLARRANVNLIIGDGVTGKVTVYLENVSPKDAIRLIAESKGYVFQEEKNIIKVRSKEAAENQPLEVRVYTLKYAKAEDMAKVLTDLKGTRGKVQVDARSNALVISDTAPNLEKIMPVVEALDSQTTQVMIEAKFIETFRNPHKDLGINWANTLVNHAVTAGGPNLKSGDAPGSFQLVNPGTGLIPPYPTSSGLSGPFMGTAMLDAGRAQVLISFFNQDANSELLANPRVVTTDGTKATMNITQQYPLPQFQYSEQTASMQINGFAYKDIGIILSVTPRINKDDFITLDVNPQVSSSTAVKKFQTGTSTFDIPIIETRQATTSVLIKSGNTLAIGGLLRTDVSDTFTKVPVLGDIPGLGVLFRSKSLDKLKRNLLIFLTPTVVTADAKTGAASTGYEQNANGQPPEEVFTNDKWMPKDNARPRDLMKDFQSKTSTSDKSNGKAPTQNFGPK